MDHAAYARDFEELAAQFRDCEGEAELRNAQACLGRLYAHAHKSGLYQELPKLPERNRIADTGGWVADAECLALILGAIVPKLPGVLSTGGYSLTARVDSNGTLTGAAERRGDWVRLARQGFAKICRLLAGWAAEAAAGNGRARGRRGPTAAAQRADDSLVADWKRESARGVNKRDFCRSRGITKAELQRAIDRARKRPT